MIAALLIIAAATAQPQTPAADTFPHATHRHLFANCLVCHAGIVSGDSTQARPTSAQCASCHDGRTKREVTWVPREARPSNLHFDHRRHFAAAPDSAADARSCRGCHAIPGGTAFMDVARARPERCITCHAHEADAHLSPSNRCPTCHLPLAQATRLAAATIANFPKPPSHDSSFVSGGHADVARTSQTCQVCHSRDFCASCHANAARLAPIQALGTDERVAQLVQGRTVTYRPPESHAAGDFVRRHGLIARRDAQTCATCHTRESCQTCHTQAPLVPIVAAMPARVPGGAPGVDLSAWRPPGHVPGFRTNHREVAAGGDASCSRCHRQTFCATCHDGPKQPAFHAVNFVTRHAAAALTNANECAACHQVQKFCRDCHLQIGTAASSRSSATGQYHNAQPNWFFAHSGAARRSLESCTTCHTQSFCLECHSASQGRRISPHGPGFQPSMGDKNPGMCRICHVQGPPTGP